MKQQSSVATEILKHFVFVIPPNDDLALLDKKKELEGDSDLFLNTIVAKVRDPRLVLHLAGFTGWGGMPPPYGSSMNLV